MIIIDTENKIWVLYTRVNRRVKWQYSEYGGRYESVEKAIEAAKKHYGSEGFEYCIENLFTDEEVKGFVNWKK